MAKKKSKIPESLIKVTSVNRKFCIQLGRECLVTTVSKLEIDKSSHFIIRPRLKYEGWFEGGGNKCYITNIESAEDYTSSFDEIITFLINEERLYINPTKKLITFNYNEKRK